MTMRFSLALLSLAATAFGLDASVWTLDATVTNPVISAENARLVLAHRLGLSSYHKLGRADRHTLELLSAAQKPLFSGGPAPARKLMIIVEGVEDNLLSSKPSFTISNPPNAASNKKMVEDFLIQDMHRRGASQCGNQVSSHGLIQGGLSAQSPAGLCMLSNQDWNDHSNPQEQLRILYEDTSLLHEAYDSYQTVQDSTAIFHVDILSDAIAKYGSDSKEYKIILAELRAELNNAITSGKFSELLVIGVPTRTRTSKEATYGSYEMPLVARQEQPLTETIHSAQAAYPKATTAANRTLPKTTISQCWSSESACKANTAQCSGHGSCRLKYSEKVSDEESGADCWACACTPTVLKSGTGSNKTIYWGGPACQKKDISVPFFLFAGFTIAALAAISYGVGLLYSIGEEDLPSVLGAGVAPPSSRK